MNPDLLRPVLYGKKLLTSDEAERLSLPGQTTRDKNMFILQQIPTKGSRAFELFLEALQETIEEEPVHSELLDAILSDEEYNRLVHRN